MTTRQHANATTMKSPDWQGENLIFLISQPRAGSTMLQKMLAGHPRIHTLAEPWIMLHPCFALRNRGCTAYYEAGGWAQRAMSVFVDSIGGPAVYDQAVREMGHVLYGAALQGSGKRYFLDKTPRYYWIIEELARVFPGARFVFLLRNPLAVLCSILRSWVTNPWVGLDAYRSDLLRAPECLCKAIEGMGERAAVVYYERLVAEPNETLDALMRKLCIPFDPSVIQYGAQPANRMSFGDTHGVLEHVAPDPSHAARWLEDLSDPRIWRFVRDYLDMLRRKDMILPGYDYDQLAKAVCLRKPAWAYCRGYSLWAAFKAGAMLRRVRCALRS